MNYYQNIEQAIIYIEENLTSKLILDDVANAAYLSKFHFHRLFKLLLGDTVSEYIRKRRLYNASQDLIYSDKKIADIAYDYQFESHEAFTRSFQSIFNTTPKKYREHRIERIIYEKQKINNDKLLHTIDGISKNPEILEIEEKRIVGFSAKTSIKNNKIPYVWKVYQENSDKIKSKNSDNSTIGLYEKPIGYKIEEFSEETELNFVYGKVVNNFSDIPKKMVTAIVPSGKYAKFTHKGNVQSIRLTYVYIFGSWLPKSGQKINMNPDFEQFDERFLGPFNEKSEIDIYVAIA